MRVRLCEPSAIDAVQQPRPRVRLLILNPETFEGALKAAATWVKAARGPHDGQELERLMSSISNFDLHAESSEQPWRASLLTLF